MISIQTKPESLAEIRRAVDIHLAEQGISRSAYAVRILGITPQTLQSVLQGRQSPASQLEAVRKINELTGASMAAWEK
ncbi:MAG: hypothetical protein OHK0011_00880 [Turneriella sp.]